jgi:hypothetical protein
MFGRIVIPTGYKENGGVFPAAGECSKHALGKQNEPQQLTVSYIVPESKTRNSSEQQPLPQLDKGRARSLFRRQPIRNVVLYSPTNSWAGGSCLKTRDGEGCTTLDQPARNIQCRSLFRGS